MTARDSEVVSHGGAEARRGKGLFVVGTDTGVGKTVVAARIAAEMVQRGLKVGVYKPAASGCVLEGGRLASEDAVRLWDAAGRPGDLEVVCPQRFLAPLAPHLAAREEGGEVDVELLRRGVDYWRERSDLVIVEGAGGLMSPLAEDLYVADLAAEFEYPLVLVVPNRIGAINAALVTLIAAEARQRPLPVAGIVLNDLLPPDAEDPSIHSNRAELERRCRVPVLAGLAHGAAQFDRVVNWIALAYAAG